MLTSKRYPPNLSGQLSRFQRSGCIRAIDEDGRYCDIDVFRVVAELPNGHLLLSNSFAYRVNRQPVSDLGDGAFVVQVNGQRLRRASLGVSSGQSSGSSFAAPSGPPLGQKASRVGAEAGLNAALNPA